MLAHLYAPMLVEPVEYPFLGLLVSGGHTIICRADGFDDITVLGTTIDDAIGEAFDKTAKFYGWGYPGGVAIDRMAGEGDPDAYRFPKPRLDKREDRRYDVSYSGLKTAVTRHVELFKVKESPTEHDLAASFQKAAVDILLDKLLLAADDTGLSTIVAGGGVAANSRLRSRLAERRDLRAIFPPLAYCGDNGAMIAGIGYRFLARGDRSPLSLNVSPRVEGFKRG
jgi:N6-L-threonylcarbamoyladenine synthase